MIAGFLAALVIPFVAQAPLGPVVPAGTNRSFQEAVLAVEDALEKSDFTAAEHAFASLPKKKIRIEWDDSKAPSEYRQGYIVARDAALSEWATIVADYAFEFVKEKSDLTVRFAADLPDSPTGLPSGAVHAFSQDPKDPRLITVIGTQRGRPQQPATPVDVRNEVMFAMASYFGMERTNFPGTATFRSDLPGGNQVRVGPGEQLNAGRVFAVVDRLREAIHKKQRLTAARPKLQVEPLRIELPKVNQADPVTFSIQVSNPGNAPLSFRFTPDCGCLGPSYAPILQAGSTAIVTVNVDTVNFSGELRHKFYVYSNDSEIPYRELPVSIDVEPLFRFSKPGPSVLQMSDSGADTEVLLVLNDASKLAVRESRLEGNSGTVAMSPWSGEYEATPGKQVKGKGYKFKVHLARSPVPGRVSTALVVSTDNIIFPVIRTNIFAQRGILAMPEAVYFGEIPKAPSVATTLLSRPDLPFKVLKVESDSPNFKGTVKALAGGDEYRLVVEFDGKSDYGPIMANLTIHTDDPKQPQLIVPIQGSVK